MYLLSAFRRKFIDTLFLIHRVLVLNIPHRNKRFAVYKSYFLTFSILCFQIVILKFALFI